MHLNLLHYWEKALLNFLMSWFKYKSINTKTAFYGIDYIDSLGHIYLPNDRKKYKKDTLLPKKVMIAYHYFLN